jgi:hypothetical protein
MGLLPAIGDGLRRRRALRRYLEALSQDLATRDGQVDRLEERVATESEGFHDRLVRDVLARAEIMLGELDRRIDQLDAQTREQLADVERRLAELRHKMAALGTGREEPLSGNGGRRGDVAEPSPEAAPPAPVAE